jgi:hypothetical protein
VGADNGDATAYELKFVLDEGRAGEVEAWARQRLQLDPHGDPDLGGAYRTTTLYCDTPTWSVYWRLPSYRRRKFRLRRYGGEDLVYLERKTRRGDRVAKLRTLAAAAELALLDHAPGADWPGGWFHRQLAARDLGPAALLGYERVALVGHGAEGGVRLTFDRRLWGMPCRHWDVQVVGDTTGFLAGRAIVEMKFRAVLPGLFQEVLGLFRLEPAAVSKYRLCVDACGMNPAGRATPDGVTMGISSEPPGPARRSAATGLNPAR